MLLPPDVSLPLRVKTTHQEYRGHGIPPVYVYTLQVDPEQARAKSGNDVYSNDPGRDPLPWVLVSELRVTCELPLPIGVGDLFTVDLLPADAAEVIPDPPSPLYLALRGFFFGNDGEEDEDTR